MILLINNNTYATNTNVVNSCIKAAKDSNKGKNIILALQYKKGARSPLVTEMRKDEFVTTEVLMKQVAEFNKNGIVVHYNTSQDE